MPRPPDSGRIDLAEVFRRVQTEMLAQLKVGGLFEHASTMGAATEKEWLNLLNRYLPQRYRATPAFAIDSRGNRSRQIDIAIFDNLYSPLLFPHEAGQHIPAESIYAIFEVKPTISKQWIREAAEKAATVRKLRRTTVPVIAAGRRRTPIPPSPILAGILATSSVWSADTFKHNVPAAVLEIEPKHRLDLGCSLEHGSFEYRRRSSRAGNSAGKRNIQVSTPEESLIFFILRLLDRLRNQGTAPAADLMEYGRSLHSFH